MPTRFSLDHVTCIALEGADARAFAESQFTASIDDMTARTWSPLAWCEPKGRVLAFMLACPGEDRVDLALPTEQAETIARRLRLFTIGREVSVSDPRALVGSIEPESGMPVLACDAGRAMMVVPLNQGKAAEPAGPYRWRQLDLCQGLPWLSDASSGEFLPQWLGLEALGGLSYTKGCYPGQEIIARVHYRGTVKYGLMGLRISASVVPEPMSRVSDAEGRPLGHWLYGLQAGASTIGLAVLSTEGPQADSVQVHDGASGQTARVTPPEALC